MSARRPYVRPMAGWWRRDPWFREYMLHEATALAVAAYALILLAGLFMLGQGEAAWAQWLAFLGSPLSLALHGVLLLAFAYHAWTWFRIMPRTLPPIRFRGARVAATSITRIGLAAALVASALLYVVVARLAA